MDAAREFYFPSSDMVHRCYARLWLPEGEARGVVQLVHGVAEYVDRYDPFARFLTDHGLAVCGHDHLGHGRTGEEAGFFGHFADRGGWSIVTADVRRLRQRLEESFSGVPHILLGHSMGSFMVRTYLCRYPGEVDGAILSGTGQEPAALVALGRALCAVLGLVRGRKHRSELVYSLSLGAYNRPFAPGRTPADWISRDEALVDRYLADPCCTFRPTVGLMGDMMAGLQYIVSRRALAQMDKKTPIYLFSGDCDPVGQMGEGVKRVYSLLKEAGCTDVTMKLYPGGRHEMLNELNREEVWADVLAWLERVL